MVDERAMEAAVAAMPESFMDGISRLSLARFVEFYEAALWRPIEDAPRISWPNECGDWLLVSWPDSEWPPQTLRRGPNRGVWLTTDTGVWYESSLIESNAMYRTIDPPRQDLISDHEPKESDDAA